MLISIQKKRMDKTIRNRNRYLLSFIRRSLLNESSLLNCLENRLFKLNRKGKFSLKWRTLCFQKKQLFLVLNSSFHKYTLTNVYVTFGASQTLQLPPACYPGHYGKNR